jgi:hypothetical protein
MPLIVALFLLFSLPVSAGYSVNLDGSADASYIKPYGPCFFTVAMGISYASTRVNLVTSIDNNLKVWHGVIWPSILVSGHYIECTAYPSSGGVPLLAGDVNDPGVAGTSLNASSSGWFAYPVSQVVAICSMFFAAFLGFRSGYRP